MNSNIQTVASAQQALAQLQIDGKLNPWFTDIDVSKCQPTVLAHPLHEWLKRQSALKEVLNFKQINFIRVQSQFFDL